MTQEQKEQLAPNEQLRQEQEPQNTPDGSLTIEQVERLYAGREANLETLKQWVSLKFYYRAVEKIKQEQAAFKKLLRIESVKQDILSEYSFVLDSAYFEQKFLN